MSEVRKAVTALSGTVLLTIGCFTGISAGGTALTGAEIGAIVLSAFVALGVYTVPNTTSGAK